MVNGLLECGEENLCNHLGKAKTLEHKDCNAVRNSVVAAAGIIHGESQRVVCLVTDIAEKKLVQACVDCTATFATAMLEGGDGVCAFSMGKAHLSKVFVADLKLGTHELDESHFVNKEDIGFLKNLNVSDSLPSKGREARLQWDVLECGINSIECRGT